VSLLPPGGVHQVFAQYGAPPIASNLNLYRHVVAGLLGDVAPTEYKVKPSPHGFPGEGKPCNPSSADPRVVLGPPGPGVGLPSRHAGQRHRGARVPIAGRRERV
jgi:hypothetical protein